MFRVARFMDEWQESGRPRLGRAKWFPCASQEVDQVVVESMGEEAGQWFLCVGQLASVDGRCAGCGALDSPRRIRALVCLSIDFPLLFRGCRKRSGPSDEFVVQGHIITV